MDFLPGEAELIHDIDRLQHTQALFNVINRQLERLRVDVEDNPHIDDENIKRDFRFKLGMVKALRWVLSRPEEARDTLTNSS